MQIDELSTTEAPKNQPLTENQFWQKIATQTNEPLWQKLTTMPTAVLNKIRDHYVAPKKRMISPCPNHISICSVAQTPANIKQRYCTLVNTTKKTKLIYDTILNTTIPLPKEMVVPEVIADNWLCNKEFRHPNSDSFYSPDCLNRRFTLYTISDNQIIPYLTFLTEVSPSSKASHASVSHNHTYIYIFMVYRENKKNYTNSFLFNTKKGTYKSLPLDHLVGDLTIMQTTSPVAWHYDDAVLELTDDHYHKHYYNTLTCQKITKPLNLDTQKPSLTKSVVADNTIITITHPTGPTAQIIALPQLDYDTKNLTLNGRYLIAQHKTHDIFVCYDLKKNTTNVLLLPGKISYPLHWKQHQGTQSYTTSYEDEVCKNIQNDYVYLPNLHATNTTTLKNNTYQFIGRKLIWLDWDLQLWSQDVSTNLSPQEITEKNYTLEQVLFYEAVIADPTTIHPDTIIEHELFKSLAEEDQEWLLKRIRGAREKKKHIIAAIYARRALKN